MSSRAPASADESSRRDALLSARQFAEGQPTQSVKDDFNAVRGELWRIQVGSAGDDRKLKLCYAKWLPGLMVAQVAIADVLFFIYAWAGVHWKIPDTVISVWLSATLVELIGVVLVVTRYLFPSRDSSA